MPPRHHYWTIILEDKPTAFRAHTQEELIPTLRQLQVHHPDAVMKWFARGRLWASQDEERADALAKRRPKGAPAGDRRPRDWRPGGDHKDPRDRFKVPRDEKRRRFAENLRRDRPVPEKEGPPPGAPPEGPPQFDRPPRPDRPDRPNRPPGFGRGPRPNRPGGFARGPRTDRPPRFDRPPHVDRAGKPPWKRDENRNRAERPWKRDRPGPPPFGKPPGDRRPPSGERPAGTHRPPSGRPAGRGGAGRPGGRPPGGGGRPPGGGGRFGPPPQGGRKPGGGGGRKGGGGRGR
jgi:translation initiation factor IF-2